MFAKMNIKAVRALAEENGITLAMAQTEAGGRPVKSSWVRLLEKAGVEGAFEPSAEATSPAKMVREGLLRGVSDNSIRRGLKIYFPDYGAGKIACSVYRRELIAKGLMKAKKKKAKKAKK